MAPSEALVQAAIAPCDPVGSDSHLERALAGQIALHVAEHHGPVVFVSMELTDVDLAVRWSRC
jgi:hypothetical protein